MWAKVFTSMHFKQANGDQSKKNNERTLLLHIVFLSKHYLYLADERHYFWQPSFLLTKYRSHLQSGVSFVELSQAVVFSLTLWGVHADRVSDCWRWFWDHSCFKG